MITFESLCQRNDKIAVVGLGYVGLPLAVSLSDHFEVVGFDKNSERVEALRSGCDRTLEVSSERLNRSAVMFTSSAADLATCRLIIVAVPTPIDQYRIPDLEPVRSASGTVGKNLAAGSCVVYESTVYPGVTEEVCVPILERESGLVSGREFTVGYSPERINPGDKVHRLENIVKIVSGSDEATRQLLVQVYATVVSAGIHEASSIKVAEAAKVIENTQRDINIALMNELAMIFDRMQIDTLEVLKAAGTKWNFLPFQPGLVGGHCIGVDPYYLTFKAESLGYHPEMILAGRRINDGMGKYIAERTVKMLISANKQVRGARVAVLGLTFKENVPDLRNTRVVDIIRELKDYGIDVIVHDPCADSTEANAYYGVELRDMTDIRGMDAVIVAVSHKLYVDMGMSRIAGLCSDGIPILIDVKGVFGAEPSETGHIAYWRL
ncbi:MAG: nucleotide sugar dehydrogenase [Desulfobacterales bacterium]|nr:nucleotide sugar dehydrogenase [Desulfobacterales bacterium]MDD4072808.1 nucleotide sugar dehydrogenase [Desulfobacterales bacterium]MDD4391714.1 nucleotide sugar dehydrogenase [Desulfobacterales bacterium]